MRLEFSIDGNNISSSNIRLSLNGKQFLLEELSEQYKEYWYIMDKATVLVLNEEGISVGEHAVTVDMLHRIPYAGYSGKYLTLPSIATKTLLAL